MSECNLCVIERLIIFLSAVIAGMIVGMSYKKPYKYHGPNAKKFISTTYRDKKNNKCYQFGIKLIGKPIKYQKN